jgi:DNA-binding HxlR family transcriptional regulator
MLLERIETTEPIMDNGVVPCPIRDILGRVGGRWTVDVLVELNAAPRHFNELHRVIRGVSRRMLTLTLRGLERDGIISRTVRPGPVRVVDYAVTELGRELSEQMVALTVWSQLQRPQIERARAAYDARSLSDRQGAIA